MEQRRDSPGPVFTKGYECGRAGASRSDNPHLAHSAEAEQSRGVAPDLEIYELKT
jgi:hypothetical protein